MFSLEKCSPARSLTRSAIGSDFDDLVSRFFEEPFFNVRGPQMWTPSSDVIETEDQIKICLDLPGMKKENLDIQLTESNTLVVRGERKYEEQDKSKYHRLERFYGNFTRSFVLPTSVDAEKINANFKDGVLEIILPKVETAKSRKITVK